MLMSQRVLTRKVFHPSILETPGMADLVEYVQHKAWLYLKEEPVPSVYENEV